MLSNQLNAFDRIVLDTMELVDNNQSDIVAISSPMPPYQSVPSTVLFIQDLHVALCTELLRRQQVISAVRFDFSAPDLQQWVDRFRASTLNTSRIDNIMMRGLGKSR
jgi:hypothetical protein